jgi:3-oxoadipate enol-lactonase
MPYAINDGVRIHWQEVGAGSPLLLIMGHSYSSRLWYPLLDVLAVKHRVICFDNRGTGGSDTTRRVSMQQLAQDALAVMDAAGVAGAHVHGVSMGGVIALELAMQQPQRVRSLMLGCTGILSAEKRRMPAVVRLLYFLPRAWLKWILSRVDGYGSRASAAAVARDKAVLLSDGSTKRGLAAQAAALAGYCTSAQAVGALRMPVLVLHGDEDRTVPHDYAIELVRAIPGSRLHTVKGAAHNYLVPAVDEVAPLMLGFMAESEAL